MRIRKIQLLGILVGVAASVWLGWTIFRVKTIPQRFARISVGDSREQVVQLLGKPKSVEKCGEPFGNPGGKFNCKEDYLYASPYAPVIPEYWSVSFDASGRVVEKYHFLSP